MTATNLAVLEQSPFFERLEPRSLKELAARAERRAFEDGQTIFTEGAPATTFYLLVSGSVLLSYGTGDEEAAALQTISHPGDPIGWSAIVEPYAYRATATARETTDLLALDHDVLDRQAEAHSEFGAAIMRAVIGVVGERLRAMRLRLVARRYDDATAAIRTLLEQSAPQLSVASPLHKLPLYLEHRLTLDDAFYCVDLLRTQGDKAEREIAALCADLLEQVRLELRLYQQLQAVYEAVANAPPTVPPEEVRVRSLRGFQRLFADVPHRILGWEHLPAQTGHVFIMNHLGNHPDNVLPNRFVLTLDTHFVSSMILFEKYGEAPIRVVRKSRPDEYGHQGFYDRLGYIYVYAGLVDPDPDDPASSPEARRRFFLDAAASAISAGKNIVICPEGTSTSTEESPLRLRPGAFRLASYARPEPLLVPIAVANFDKKLTRTAVVAVIHPPFRLSEEVKDPSDDQALLGFLNDRLHPRYREWVQEAAALAESMRRT